VPTARSILRAELKSNLLPALRTIGFTGPNAISGNALLHDFKRPGSDGTHVLTVQLEKYGRPRFTLNLSIEPPEGFEILIHRGGAVRRGRVQPRRGATTRAWFRADPPLWKRLLGQGGSSPAQAVAACVALLPEVEAWWQTQVASPHITVVEHKFPGQPNASV